jgi:hypothetical protein
MLKRRHTMNNETVGDTKIRREQVMNELVANCSALESRMTRTTECERGDIKLRADTPLLQANGRKHSNSEGVEVVAWKLEIDDVRTVMEKEAQGSPQAASESDFFAIYMIEESRIYLQISEVESVMDAPEVK